MMQPEIFHGQSNAQDRRPRNPRALGSRRDHGQRAGLHCMVLACALLFFASTAHAGISHPPLRTAPPPSQRPLGDGPKYFVDAEQGSDENKGTQAAPWQTINHAMELLEPGDTLVLRGGTYYENVYCAVAGTKKSPITIRSHPGEQAVIDGSFREFSESPQTAWTPFEGGAPGEYRSAKRYGNIRDVHGTFGDSMIGMSTYYHAIDLRAEGELTHWDDWEKRKEVDSAPLYCGPGLWYDQATGYIHSRLAHTNLPGIANFKGETDPRKLPIVAAPFRSVPLFVDHAKHLRVQDLIIQGGGYDTVIIDYAQDLVLENITVWSGSYGVRVSRTVGLKAINCGFYGNCPPWQSRGDSSKRAYPGRPYRDITRLNTHATWVIDSGREFSVFATPVNDDWEIAHCEFTDSHDGPYLGGINLDFHHNLLENTQDDGLYLSQMYPRHIYGGGGATLKIHDNYFSGALTALAFGGLEDTKDKIYIYRNIFELRRSVYTGRPRSTTPDKPGFSTGKVIGDHGSPPWPEMTIYHNTFVTEVTGRFATALLSVLTKDKPRRVYNNIVVSQKSINIPTIQGKGELVYETDGNLYWSDQTPQQKAEAELKRTRKGKDDANSVIGDPGFASLSPDLMVPSDFSIGIGSAALNKGVALPAEWPDSLRAKDAGAPDIGALPLGVPMPQVGRQ